MKRLVLFVLFVLASVPAMAQETRLDPGAPGFMAQMCRQNRNAPGIEAYCVEQGYLPAPTHKWRSPGLAVTGVLTTIFGTGVALHWGQDTYTVLGYDYCVSDRRVDAGSCGSFNQTKVGLIMIGAGVGMTVIGTHKVKIAPLITPGVKGFSGTVTWGGKR